MFLVAIIKAKKNVPIEESTLKKIAPLNQLIERFSFSTNFKSFQNRYPKAQETMIDIVEKKIEIAP